MADVPFRIGRRRFLKGAAAGLAAALGVRFRPVLSQTTLENDTMADTILVNGHITALDPTRPQASAVAIQNGLFKAVGSDSEIMPLRGPGTRVVNLQKQTVVPGLNDSHIHVIRGGLHYNTDQRHRCGGRRTELSG